MVAQLFEHAGVGHGVGAAQRLERHLGVQRLADGQMLSGSRAWPKPPSALRPAPRRRPPARAVAVEPAAGEPLFEDQALSRREGPALGVGVGDGHRLLLSGGWIGLLGRQEDRGRGAAEAASGWISRVRSWGRARRAPRRGPGGATSSVSSTCVTRSRRNTHRRRAAGTTRSGSCPAARVHAVGLDRALARPALAVDVSQAHHPQVARLLDRLHDAGRRASPARAPPRGGAGPRSPSRPPRRRGAWPPAASGGPAPGAGRTGGQAGGQRDGHRQGLVGVEVEGGSVVRGSSVKPPDRPAPTRSAPPPAAAPRMSRSIVRAHLEQPGQPGGGERPRRSCP